jgi:putative PIN family toxin of toxin-antitoxin system
VQSVTLDSNIFISLCLPRGAVAPLADGTRRPDPPDVSDTILNELGRVLHDKFEWSAEDVRVVRAKILNFANHVTPVEAVHVVQADADDDAILECAAAARSDFLVTGDKHLLKLGSFRGTRIINPASFLALRRGREGEICGKRRIYPWTREGNAATGQCNKSEGSAKRSLRIEVKANSVSILSGLRSPQIPSSAVCPFDAVEAYRKAESDPVRCPSSGGLTFAKPSRTW